MGSFRSEGNWRQQKSLSEWGEKNFFVPEESKQTFFGDDMIKQRANAQKKRMHTLV